jgi:diamine N-acetyltransferase
MLFASLKSQLACFIYHLMIDGKEQGKGYGAVAIKWLIDRLKGQYQAIILSYEPDNKAAGAFYAKLGFVETGINPEWGEMNAIYRLEGD